MSTHDAEPATPGIICPECHHANRASARFCSNCGTDLSEQTIIAPPRRRDAAAPAAAAGHAETVPMPSVPAPGVAATPADPFVVVAPAPVRSGSKPRIAVGVGALVVIAAAAWWFVGANRPPDIGTGPKPLPDPAPAASATVVAPVAPTAAPVSSAPASEPAPAPAPATTPAPAPAPASAPEPAAAPPALATPAGPDAECSRRAGAARPRRRSARESRQGQGGT